MKKRFLMAYVLAASTLMAENIDLGDVTVTATRSETNSTDLQASVLKASKENVDTTVVQKDLLNNIAGVHVTQTTSGLGHMLSIRTPITTAPRFLYLQDGIPVQSSGFFNHNAMSFTNFSTAGDAEVLKGAGTALYGSDAIAGTVNVLTPSSKDFQGTEIDTRGGSYGYGMLGIKKGGKTEDGTYFIGASHAHKDGWKAHSAFDRSELTFRSDKILNNNNSLKTIFTANRSDAEQTGDLIGLDALYNQTTSLGDLDLSKVDAQRTLDFARLSTQWTNLSYDDIEIDTIFYARMNGNQYTATWKNSKPQNDTTANSLGIMNKTTFEKKWGKVIVGLDTEYTQSSRLATQGFDYNKTAPWDKDVAAGTIYDYDVNYVALAPYIQTRVKMSEKFIATAGLRYDYNSFELTNNTATGEYGTSGYVRVGDRKDSFNHLSPKLSLAYKASADKLLYFRYANGFRIPQASRLYELSDKVTGEFSLKPETTNTYEIGYKHKGKEHALKVAVYYMGIDDTITGYTDGSGYYNADVTHHYGIETTLKNKFNDTWSSKLSHSYSRHVFGSDTPDIADINNGSTITSITGNDMEAAPRTIASAQLIMDSQSVNGLKVMAEVQSLSSYYMDAVNTKKYEGYEVAHLSAFYKLNKSWKFNAKVSNLFDKTYAEKATYAYTKEKYTAAAPREIFVSASYHW